MQEDVCISIPADTILALYGFLTAYTFEIALTDDYVSFYQDVGDLESLFDMLGLSVLIDRAKSVGSQPALTDGDRITEAMRRG